MVAMRSTRVLLITLAVIGLVFGVGAVLSARSSDKVQGVVQVKIVNNIGTPVRFAICKDSTCSSIDALETLAPGQAYDQAFGPNDRERFAVEAQLFDAHSSDVSGKPYRCTQLRTGSVVDERYNLSTLVPCG
jgi:hypothetical protein